MIKSICIVRLSALGDVLMLTPLVRTIQAECAGITITWIISRPAYDLVEGMDGVEFIVIDKPKSIKDYWLFKKRLEGRTFDVLIAAQASFRANVLYAFIKAKRKIGYDKLRAKDGHGWFINESIAPGCDHTLEGFLKFADALNIPQKHVVWNLPIESQDYAWARAHLPQNKRVMLVNPAASKPERTWVLERYIELIQKAQALWQVEVILTGGPSLYEANLAESIAKAVNVHNLVGKTKPKQLLALIDLADVVVCPDTGPSHMAAAVATPVVALHAVTSANVSGPYTYRHLAVDYYPEAVATVLKSNLEETSWGTHAHGEKCMELVPVDAVMEKLKEVL